MISDINLKKQKATIRNIVRSSSSQQEAINELAKLDVIKSRLQAKRLYFKYKGGE